MQNITVILIMIILILICVRVVIYLTNMDKQDYKTLNDNERELSESIAKFTERCQAGKNVSDFKGVQFKGNRPPLRDITTYD